MKTKKQEELVNSFLSTLEDEPRALYQDIITCLSDLGYNPCKDRANISFKHDLHNKQIAKVGIKKGKETSPFFALRFSACADYSQKFTDSVVAYITKYPTRTARCTNNDCNFCAGEPDTHVYTYTFANGEKNMHCGAYVIEIPNIATDDIEEIKHLIIEEHDYLIKHENADVNPSK